jgi:hypothetical protein
MIQSMNWLRMSWGSLHLLVHSYAHEQQDDVLALGNWGSVPPLAFELVHIDFELGIQLQEAFDGLANAIDSACDALHLGLPTTRIAPLSRGTSRECTAVL